MRPVVQDDIPRLQALYPRHCGDSLLVCVRDADTWAYELFAANRDTPGGRTVYMIEDREATAVAYAQIFVHKGTFRVREFGVQEGRSWRDIALFVTRELKKRADKRNQERDKPITHIEFNLGEQHAIYDALGQQLEQAQKPYAWYMRVPDLPRFLQTIAPELDRRLAGSVMAGYSGSLRLNLYRTGWKLNFKEGQMAGIEPYQADAFYDSDAVFPELTFLHLLLGHRSFTQLDSAFADCFALNPEAAVLLNCLFPRRPADINPIS
jgi:hypothetical protein